MKRVTKTRPPIENLTGLLDHLCKLVDCAPGAETPEKKVSARAIFEAIGRRAYGPLLLLLGLFSISPLTAVPGMTWATAALTLVIALQLAFGMQRPWLPGGLLKAEVSAQAVVKAVDVLRPWARRIDVVLRPRFAFLTKLPFVIFIGLLCALAALITFPLGFIPLAPLAPGLAIVLFGLGLVARDGVLLTIGAATVIGGVVLAMKLVDRIPWPW